MRGAPFRASLEPYLALCVGFVLSATFMCVCMGAVGEVVGAGPGAAATAVLAPSLLLVLAGLERTPIRRSLLVRQTPSSLHRHFGSVLGGLAWGLDTGTMVSTYRTSFATWGVLVLCLLGVAGPWAGVAYAAGFCLPLGAAIVAPALRSRAPGTDSFVMRIADRRRTMHAATALLLALTAASLVVG